MREFLMFSVMATVVVMTLISCQKSIEAAEKRDDSGIVYEKKPVWRVENTSDPNQSSGGAMFSWIINGDILSTYASKPGSFKSDIALLNGETGQRKWTWNNLLRDYDAVILGRNEAIPYQDRLFYNYGPRNYCIDLKSGQTIWGKNRDYTAMNGVTYSLGPIYFARATPNALMKPDGQADRIYRGDMRTGEEVEITQPSYNREKWQTNVNWAQYVGRITDVYPLLDGADTLLIATYDEPSITRYEYEAYIGLYNLTKRQWVYDRKRLNPQYPHGFSSSWLTIVGDKMFTIVNRAVACSNWRTGELVWFRALSSSAAIPTPIENKYLAVFSVDSHFFLLDINTGQVIWEKDREIMAVTTQMHYDQGVLYYLTKSLNAIEIPSGKRLWRILAPTTEKLDGNFWGFIVGRPGTGGQKGRVYVRTGYHTYCYEAIK